MTDRHIIVYFPPLEPGQFVVVSPTSVCYAQSPDEDVRPFVRGERDSPWTEIERAVDLIPTNDFFNDLLEMSIGNENLLQFFIHGGVSMWQFLPSYIWREFFLAIQFIDMGLEIIERTKPDRIRVLTTTPQWNKVWIGAWQVLCQAHGIGMTVEKSPSPDQGSLFRRAIRPLAKSLKIREMLSEKEEFLYRRELRSLARQAEDGMNVDGHSRAGKKLLFATHSRYWSIRETGERKESYDLIYSTIIRELETMGWDAFVGIDCPYTSHEICLQKLQEQISYSDSEIVWRNFYSYGNYCESRMGFLAARIAFAAKWRRMQKDPGFLQQFQYRNIPLMPALRDILKTAFLKILPDCWEMLLIARTMLDREKPNAVMATYETGPFQRALLIASKERGNPTVGLMHGMIFRNHYDYCHQRIFNDNRGIKEGFIIPDRFCVWGEFHRRVLTENFVYPRDSVVVTGSWQHEVCDREDMKKKAEALREQLCNTGNEKVMLLGGCGENVADFLSICIEEVLKKKNHRIIVKLHPICERLGLIDRYADLEHAGLLARGEDLLSSIMASDLVISQVSTTIAEAVLLDRAVIWANFSKCVGYEAYLDDGAVLYAETKEELAKAIKQALYDEPTILRLAENRKQMRVNFFGPEGQVPSENVARTVHDMTGR
ncbi:MAG TPA: hypothetical protein PLQ35_01260 [bacterium]|nr:hypothetical protein [bacterium]HQL60900.1 hypothetical protein [bacterium]